MEGRMGRRKYWKIILITIGVASTLTAQSVDTIIQKNLKSRGGYGKLKSIQTLKSTGKFHQMGMEIPYIMLQKRPNRLRIDATMQDQTMVQAFDGKTAWQIFPFMGDPTPKPMPEADARNIINQADFDGHLLDYKAKGYTIELVGQEEVRGFTVHKLKVTLKNGDVLQYYVDVDDCLERKVSTMAVQAGQSMEIETFMDDYKEVRGLMIPHKVESQAGGNTVSLITLESVELNPDIDDSVFVMPEE
jgi:outer membrane lipoprotein-sorting protein